MRKPIQLQCDEALALRLGATPMPIDENGDWTTKGDCFYTPVDGRVLEWPITPELLIVLNERGE